MKNNIERFFFSTFLKVLIAGGVIVVSSDILNDALNLINVGIASVFIISYLILRYGSLKVAVLFFTSTIALVMLYRCFTLDGFYSGTRMILFLTLGFIYSLLLESPWRWIMHAITLTSLVVLFTLQLLYPENFLGKGGPEIISEGLPYFVIYVSIGLSTMILKDKYDAQKEELLLRQNELNAINDNLEALVNERSQKIIIKNEQLTKYAFTNAHNVRGPLARILGLIMVSKFEKESDYPLFFDKVKEEAESIDKILKQINDELDEHID
jgi:signal transduction histidine kinase